MPSLVHVPRDSSQRAAVEVLNRNACQVNPFDAPNIDCSDLVPLGIGAFAVWMDTACLTKAMLDHLLVESVGSDLLFRREHSQLFARHKPQERSLARTDRTIACQCRVNFTFSFEHDPGLQRGDRVKNSGAAIMRL